MLIKILRYASDSEPLQYHDLLVDNSPTSMRYTQLMDVFHYAFDMNTESVRNATTKKRKSEKVSSDRSPCQDIQNRTFRTPGTKQNNDGGKRRVTDSDLKAMDTPSNFIELKKIIRRHIEGIRT